MVLQILININIICKIFIGRILDELKSIKL